MKEGGRPNGPKKVKTREHFFRLAFSCLAGLVLAALIYSAATRAGGAIGSLFPIHEAEIVTFTILLTVSVVEMPLMLFGLRHLRSTNTSNTLVNLVSMIFIAFSAIYASIQVLLFGESNYSMLLAGLSLARCGSVLAFV